MSRRALLDRRGEILAALEKLDDKFVERPFNRRARHKWERLAAEWDAINRKLVNESKDAT